MKDERSLRRKLGLLFTAPGVSWGSGQAGRRAPCHLPPRTLCASAGTGLAALQVHLHPRRCVPSLPKSGGHRQAERASLALHADRAFAFTDRSSRSGPRCLAGGLGLHRTAPLWPHLVTSVPQAVSLAWGHPRGRGAGTWGLSTPGGWVSGPGGFTGALGVLPKVSQGSRFPAWEAGGICEFVIPHPAWRGPGSFPDTG